MAISPSDRSRRGYLGEQLVTQWLKQSGWAILAVRWQCRWGELDIVAQGEAIADGGHPVNLMHPGSPQRSLMLPTLAFVEVKTRSRHNWDSGGSQAVTSSKQQKLWQAAALFLTEYPQWSQEVCRFDVALVTCQPIPQRSLPSTNLSRPELTHPEPRPFPKVEVGQGIPWQGYELTLQQYIPHAFYGLDT